MQIVIKEYDLDINPTKIVKGKVQCKLVVGAQDQVDGERRGNEIAMYYYIQFIPTITKVVVT